MSSDTTPEVGKRRLEELSKEVPDSLMELYTRAGACCRDHNYADAAKIAQEGVEHARTNMSDAGQLWCLHILGNALYYLGRLSESRKAHLEALSLCTKLEFPSGIASSLNNLGLIEQKEGKPVAARKLFQDSISIYEGLGSDRVKIVKEHLCSVQFTDKGA